MENIRNARRCDEGARAIREGSCRRHPGSRGSIHRVALVVTFWNLRTRSWLRCLLAEKLNLAQQGAMDEHASKTTLVVPACRGGASHSDASACQCGCTNKERPPAARPHGGKREDDV